MKQALFFITNINPLLGLIKDQNSSIHDTGTPIELQCYLGSTLNKS